MYTNCNILRQTSSCYRISSRGKAAVLFHTLHRCTAILIEERERGSNCWWNGLLSCCFRWPSLSDELSFTHARTHPFAHLAFTAKRCRFMTYSNKRKVAVPWSFPLYCMIILHMDHFKPAGTFLTCGKSGCCELFRLGSIGSCLVCMQQNSYQLPYRCL